MKKTKKLLALMLVVVIMLPLLALSAAAADGSKVEPLIVYHMCGRCGGDATSEVRIVDEDYFTVSNPNYCVNGIAESHTHWRNYCIDYFTCTNCGKYNSGIYSYDTCLG